MFPSIIPHNKPRAYFHESSFRTIPFYGREDAFHSEKFKDRVDAVKHMVRDRKSNRHRFQIQDLRRQVAARGNAQGSGNTMTFVNTNMNVQHTRGGVMQNRTHARNLLERRATQLRELETQHIDDPLLPAVGVQQPIPLDASETKKLAITMNLDEMIALVNRGVDSKDFVKPDEIKKLYMSILEVGFAFSKDELLNIKDKVDFLLSHVQGRKQIGSNVARTETFKKIAELVNIMIASYDSPAKERALKLKTLARNVNIKKKKVSPPPPPPPSTPQQASTPVRARRRAPASARPASRRRVRRATPEEIERSPRAPQIRQATPDEIVRSPGPPATGMTTRSKSIDTRLSTPKK